MGTDFIGLIEIHENEKVTVGHSVSFLPSSSGSKIRLSLAGSEIARRRFGQNDAG